MGQIAILLEGVDTYDLSLDVDNGDHLLIDESLRTAVLVSLLTDRRVDPSEAPDPSDLGGYWGDTWPDSPGDLVGSRLWTLAGAKFLPETMSRAEGYVREALSWMVADGVVAQNPDIQVELEFNGHTLSGRIVITKPLRAVPGPWEVAWAYTFR